MSKETTQADAERIKAIRSLVDKEPSDLVDFVIARGFTVEQAEKAFDEYSRTRYFAHEGSQFGNPPTIPEICPKE